MPVNLILVSLGLLFGIALLATGYLVGRRWGASGTNELNSLLDDDERHRMVGLLQGLSQWTTEYSGNVSQYQTELGEINQVVRQGLETGGRADTKLVALLGQIMSSNEQLQTRLDAAEEQLDHQTKQIESYLTEARTDGLTGVFNRRAFDKKLDELFAIYRRGGSAFTLALVDIDHFKSVNDNYGHPVGDMVLQQVAAKLDEELRDALMVARYGGEEFVILTDTPIRAASRQFDEVRRRLSEIEFQTEKGILRATVSIGMSQTNDDLAIGPLVRRADEALYAAKKIGRDRVYFDDGRGPQLVGAPEVVRT
ncbi:MAG: GGDEF domain-containing protein [Planctomycetota bacterium]